MWTFKGNAEINVLPKANIRCNLKTFLFESGFFGLKKEGVARKDAPTFSDNSWHHSCPVKKLEGAERYQKKI